MLHQSFAFDGQRADGQTITIRVLPDNPQRPNRTEIPFFAEYNDVLNSVVLSCVDECGDVSVTLVSTAGDWYQTVFDTEDGSIIIPASGDSGHYTLTLVTSDGATSVGEFDL